MDKKKVNNSKATEGLYQNSGYDLDKINEFPKFKECQSPKKRMKEKIKKLKKKNYKLKESVEILQNHINDMNQKQKPDYVSKEVEDIYPAFVLMDRYRGTYSGGAYTAWNIRMEDIPSQIFADDVTCGCWWGKYKDILKNNPNNIFKIGFGDTPTEAMNNLSNRLHSEYPNAPKYDPDILHVNCDLIFKYMLSNDNIEVEVKEVTSEKIEEYNNFSIDAFNDKYSDDEMDIDIIKRFLNGSMIDNDDQRTEVMRIYKVPHDYIMYKRYLYFQKLDKNEEYTDSMEYFTTTDILDCKECFTTNDEFFKDAFKFMTYYDEHGKDMTMKWKSETTDWVDIATSTYMRLFPIFKKLFPNLIPHKDDAAKVESEVTKDNDTKENDDSSVEKYYYTLFNKMEALYKNNERFRQSALSVKGNPAISIDKLTNDEINTFTYVATTIFNENDFTKIFCNSNEDSKKEEAKEEVKEAAIPESFNKYLYTFANILCDALCIEGPNLDEEFFANNIYYMILSYVKHPDVVITDNPIWAYTLKKINSSGFRFNESLNKSLDKEYEKYFREYQNKNDSSSINHETKYSGKVIRKLDEMTEDKSEDHNCQCIHHNVRSIMNSRHQKDECDNDNGDSSPRNNL